MKARFFDRHQGTTGPGVVLIKTVADIADKWSLLVGDPDDMVRELQEALPDGKVRNVPPGKNLMGETIDYGMITLQHPAEGYPSYSWRVIKYKVLPD